jgi:hypothetical protein
VPDFSRVINLAYQRFSDVPRPVGSQLQPPHERRPPRPKCAALLRSRRGQEPEQVRDRGGRRRREEEAEEGRGRRRRRTEVSQSPDFSPSSSPRTEIRPRRGSGGLAHYNGLMNRGTSEAHLREALLRSGIRAESSQVLPTGWASTSTYRTRSRGRLPQTLVSPGFVSILTGSDGARRDDSIGRRPIAWLKSWMSGLRFWPPSPTRPPGPP